MFALELPATGVFDCWRMQARALAGQNVRSRDVVWRRHGSPASLLAGEAFPDVATFAGVMTVPKAFLALAREASCHRDEHVFALLYDLLLRVIQDGDILSNPADPAVRQLEVMAKSVRRDAHKMKAFVRFKELPQDDGNRRRFAAWFEPEHFILEHVAGFFVRRFADMDWLIATPRGSVSCVGGDLTIDAKPASNSNLSDGVEDLWRTYYGNIFNPARLKVKAMQAEMPRKYWKNLPEAALIPELIRGAEARAQGMRLAAATPPPSHLAKIKAPAVPLATAATGEFNSLADLHEHARHCRRCDLCLHATQTVCGEGASTARIMFVGEQPGDKEDIAGKPFVGPAGALFAQALAQAGLERADVYVTNAVKHFKFQPRGKRRIHQRPNGTEINICRWWLTQEIRLVQPLLLVGMGATAMLALTGDGSRVMSRRGRVDKMPEERTVLPTLHPAAILRASNTDEADAMKMQFFDDIKMAASFLS